MFQYRIFSMQVRFTHS